MAEVKDWIKSAPFMGKLLGIVMLGGATIAGGTVSGIVTLREFDGVPEQVGRNTQTILSIDSTLSTKVLPFVDNAADSQERLERMICAIVANQLGGGFAEQFNCVSN